MSTVIPQGLRPFCERVLASETASSVRIRVGSNARNAALHPGVPPVELDTVSNQGDLERRLVDSFRRANFGKRKDSTVVRAEVLDAEDKLVKGLFWTGREEPPPPVESTSSTASSVGDAMAARLVDAVVNTNETLRFTVESLASRVDTLQGNLQAAALDVGTLQAELAKAQIRAELGGKGGTGNDDDDEGGVVEGLLTRVIGDIVDKKFSAGGLTKEGILTAVKANPGKAIELLSDPEIQAAAAAAMQQQAAKEAAAAAAAPATPSPKG